MKAPLTKRQFASLQTPAMVVLLASFFIASLLPQASTQLNIGNTQESQTTSQTMIEDTSTPEDQASTDSTDQNASEQSTPDQQATGQSTGSASNSTSITINGSNSSMSIESHSNSQSSGGAKPTVTVNGQQVEIPKNGYVNNHYKVDDDDIRFRARIKTNQPANTSIDISTKTSGGTEDN